MKFKLFFSKEKSRFGYTRLHFPIGEKFSYIDGYGKRSRIYITNWILSSPIGSIRIECIPFIRN